MTEQDNEHENEHEDKQGTPDTSAPPSEQAKVREAEMEESGEENAA